MQCWHWGGKLPLATIDLSQHTHNLPPPTSHFDTVSPNVLIIYKLHQNVSMHKDPCWLDVYSYFDCG